jgi:multidrug efflux system membrane fusion protein
MIAPGKAFTAMTMRLRMTERMMRKGPSLLLAAALLAAWVTSCSKPKEKPKEEAVPVTVGKVQQRDVPISVSAIGSVQPLSTVAVKALVNGQLQRVWFGEGEDVTRGQRLFTIDPRPYQATLSEAEANLARDEASLHNAEAQAKRYVELIKKDYVTHEEYDRITSSAESARAVVAADRATIQNAQLQLSYCDIRSPMDGRTGSLLVHAGNLVKANDTASLVTINQVTPVYVNFAVPESALNAIRAHGGSSIPVSATPKESGQAIARGTLSFVDNAVDPQTGTITLKATFPNHDRALWPGQFVNVNLTLQTRAGATVVASRAVQLGQKGQYVYVVRADKGVEMRPVNVFQTVGQDSIIQSGLTPGETVVMDGQLRLTPKSKVEVKQSVGSAS